jgi:hypothetical protein
VQHAVFPTLLSTGYETSFQEWTNKKTCTKNASFLFVKHSLQNTKIKQNTTFKTKSTIQLNPFGFCDLSFGISGFLSQIMF